MEMGSNETLKIRIDVRGRRHEFELVAKQPFIIGRDPSVDFPILDDSVSIQHLELLWDGSTIRVRDMDSSNGSFRLPQDGPFLEAQFPASDYELELRLAQVRIKLVWSRQGEVSERTEVLDLGAPAPAAAVLPSPESTKKSTATKPEVAAAPKIQRAYRFGRPLLLAGLVAALAQNAYFFSQHAPFLEGDRSSWRLGSAIDLYLFWISDLPVFIGIWAAALGIAVLLRSRMKPLSSRISAFLFSSLGLVLACTVFVWPLLFLQATGHPQITQESLREMQRLERSFATHDFSQKDQNIAISSKLGDLTIPLKGSSAFYAFWHNFQKQRVVGECGGLGDENWEKKRVCLVLLFALSLDAYTSIRPVYLGTTASSLVFLSSLDGVIRVLAAEGPESENIKIFIATLEGAGLEQEALDFVKLTQSFQGREFGELMQALLNLRLTVEKKIFEAQNPERLPQAFTLNLMGPLEMGI